MTYEQKRFLKETRRDKSLFETWSEIRDATKAAIAAAAAAAAATPVAASIVMETPHQR